MIAQTEFIDDMAPDDLQRLYGLESVLGGLPTYTEDTAADAKEHARMIYNTLCDVMECEHSSPAIRNLYKYVASLSHAELDVEQLDTAPLA